MGKVFRQELMRATDYARVPAWQYQTPASAPGTGATLLNLAWLLVLAAGLGLGLAGLRRLRLVVA